MNNDHEGDVRGFYHLSEAWYGPANLIGSKYTDEVNFGFFCPESIARKALGIERMP